MNSNSQNASDMLKILFAAFLQIAFASQFFSNYGDAFHLISLVPLVSLGLALVSKNFAFVTIVSRLLQILLALSAVGIPVLLIVEKTVWQQDVFEGDDHLFLLAAFVIPVIFAVVIEFLWHRPLVRQVFLREGEIQGRSKIIDGGELSAEKSPSKAKFLPYDPTVDR